MPRLFALVLLATALLKTFLTWPFRHRRALSGFHERYAPDALVPKSKAVHRLLVEPSRCTGCRRCDQVRPARSVQAATAGLVNRGPEALSYLVQAALRSLPDADIASTGFGAYSEADLRLAEELCPYDVLLRQLAELARRAALPEDAGLSTPAEGGVRGRPPSAHQA